MSKEMTINDDGSVSFDEEGTKEIGIALFMGSGLQLESNAQELFQFLQEQPIEQIREWLVGEGGSHKTLQRIKDKYQESLKNG